MTKKYDELVQDLRNSATYRTRRTAAEALGRLGDARAVEPLTTALGDEDSSVRKAAAEALGRLGDTRAVEPLTTALGDENSAVRKAAAEALGRLGDARAVRPLTTALGDKGSTVRKAAVAALGQLGDTRAVESLATALGHEDSAVRKAAVEALGRLGDTRAVKPLIAALEDEASVVRKAAVEALGRLGDARAVKPLVATLQDIHSNVRNTSAEVLDRLKWKPQTIEQEVHYWIAKEDWYKCADIGEPAIKPLLDMISLVSPITLPYSAVDSIRHILAERFDSYPSVIEALRKRWVILYADDERDIREIVGFALHFAGFDVILTADGFEAIEKARMEQPDLILLDVRMPKITGYEVCRQLKTNPDTSAIPVVFLSAKGQEGEIRQGLASGAVEYIVKPFVPDDLTEQLKDVLRRCQLGIYEED